MKLGLAVITSGFPRRSETFALNELLALDAGGDLAAVFATKPGDGSRLQPGAERLLSRVQVLPPGTPAQQADAVVAGLGGRPVRGVHGYFAHTPAEVARLAARRLGVPYGFSAHARDVRKVAPAALADRARDAACVIACNDDVAADVRAAGFDARLVRHGVDLGRFHAEPEPSAPPLELLAVGRLVEKKGYDVLITAVRLLEQPFRLRIVGEGTERVRLAAAIRAAGLGDRVQLSGGLTHTDLPAAYASAHVVVVPSVVDRSGDRDGLPNVVLEAMACGRPVVASDVAAIGTAVDADTGVLVPPGDPGALAEALSALDADPSRRTTLGAAGRSRAESDFALGPCTARLARVLETAYA